ncbi:MAG: hypothetical protein M0R51_11440 [Clostridia bacterium]|jgi:hypothetical protein|nr:hypothetical protein [Clostridia bacterium]
MREEYKLQLKQLKEKMEKAEAFADRCPIFAEKILEKIITGEESRMKFAECYKSVRVYDGINRYHFVPGAYETILNYKGIYDGYLWVIYINTLCEYNSHEKYGLDEIPTITPVFFYDYLNSTFYCTDEQIGDLLEALNDWKIKAIAQLEIDMRDEKIRQGEKILKEYNERLFRLKEELPK